MSEEIKESKAESKALRPAGRPFGTAKSKPSSCHPDRIHYAKGLCALCYKKRAKLDREAKQNVKPVAEKAAQLETLKHMPRLDKPEVVDHIATNIIMQQVDVEKAVEKMLPALSKSSQSEIADKLQNDPRVVEAVKRQLEADGLDERSRNVYVRRMWEWLEGDSTRHQLKAAGILGKGFIGEKVTHELPQTLPISGFEEGVKALLGEGAESVNDDDDEIMLIDSDEVIAGTDIIN